MGESLTGSFLFIGIEVGLFFGYRGFRPMTTQQAGGRRQGENLVVNTAHQLLVTGAGQVSASYAMIEDEVAANGSSFLGEVEDHMPGAVTGCMADLDLVAAK